VNGIPRREGTAVEPLSVLAHVNIKSPNHRPIERAGDPMSLEQLSYLAQIIGSVGVVVSLLFVGSQIKQNTRALERTEHNSTMEQWTVVRMAILKHRDVAELMT